MNIKKILTAAGFIAFFVFTTKLGFSASPDPADAPTPVSSVSSDDVKGVKPNNFSGSLTPEPLDYAFVTGDQNKFKEVNWAKPGYDGGFENFEFEERNLPGDITASVDGHAMIRNNDYEVNALVENKKLGYVKLEYQEFSKYYDDMGGTYYPFNDLMVNKLGRPLELQIGHLRVEVGLTVEDYPHITFAYERHWKDGTKSRANWGSVTVGSISRNISPTFQYVDEVVDTFELDESHTLKGFELKGQQVFELSNSELMRREQNLTNTTTASAGKIREQYQDPQYHMFSTTESGERWFKDDKVYAGTAYHFTTLKNQEVENIFEYNKDMVLTNFTSPKAIRNARADNEYDDHAWTGSVMFMPLNWLQIDSKVRTELMDRSGNSAYPSDTTPAAAGGATPDGNINNIDISRTEDKVGRIGEGLAFRITGIPRTALYNEFEFEQLRNWLSEDRDSLGLQSVPNTGEIFGRETLTYMSRGIWTIGAQVVPAHWLDWTGHFRINRANSDYDDKRESGATASGAKSAFMDAFNTQTEELATRFTFKVKPWLKPALRYKYLIRNYDTRVEDFGNVGTSMGTHIFTYEVSLQPVHNLLIVTGLSPQYSAVHSPLAGNEVNGNTPRFQANVLSWLFNATYEINERFGLLSAVEYSQAGNFNDVAPSGLPLGAAYAEMNLSAGFSWKISKLMTQFLEYGFSRYNGDDRVDGAEYTANIISTRTKFTWD